MSKDDVTEAANDLLKVLGLNSDDTKIYSDDDDGSYADSTAGTDKLLTKIDNQRKALNNQMKKINSQKAMIDEQTDNIFDEQLKNGDLDYQNEDLKRKNKNLQEINNKSLLSNRKYFEKLIKIEHILYDDDSKQMEFH